MYQVERYIITFKNKNTMTKQIKEYRVYHYWRGFRVAMLICAPVILILLVIINQLNTIILST